MALTTQDEASRLFKALMGVSETKITRDFFEEPIRTSPAVLPSQVWQYGNWIPTGASTDPIAIGGQPEPAALQAIQAMQTNGQVYTVQVDQDTPVPLIKRWVKLRFTAIDAGTNGAFKLVDGSGNPIQNIIPFNFGDGVSYNYNLYASDGVTPIAFGIGDWVFDPNSGVIIFYNPQNVTGGGGISAANPPYFSFYQYIGGTGLPSTVSGFDGAILPITGYPAGLNSGAGTTTWSSAALDADIATITNSVQANFLGLHGWGGSDTSEGIAVSYQKLIPLINSLTKDPVATGSGINASDVLTLMARVGITVNLSNITGFVVDFVSQGAPIGSTVKVRYTPAAGTLELSFDNGSSWGPAVSGVNSLRPGQAIKIKNGSDFAIVRRIPGTLTTGVAIIDTLILNNTQTKVALLTWSSEADDFIPYVNEDATSSFDFGFPVVLKLGLIPPSLKLGQMGGGGFVDVITPQYYGVRGTSIVIDVQDVTTSTNSTANANGSDYTVTNTTGGYLEDILAQIYSTNPNFAGEITLRQGRYLLNADTTLNGMTGLKLRGEAPEVVIIDSNGATRNINIQPSATVENDVFLYDVIFNGTFNINVLALNSTPSMLYSRGILGPSVNIVVAASCGMTLTECGSLNSITVNGSSSVARSLESSVFNTVNLNGTGTTLHGCVVNTLVGDPTLGINNTLLANQITTLTSLNEQNQYIGNSVQTYGTAITAKFKMSPQKFEVIDSDGTTRRWTGFAGPIIWSPTDNLFKLSYDPTVFSINGLGQLTASFSAASLAFNPSGVTRPDGAPVTTTTIQDALAELYGTKADLIGGLVPLSQLPASLTSAGMVYKGIWVLDAHGGAYPTAAQLGGTTLGNGWFVLIGPSSVGGDANPVVDQIASDSQVYTAGDWAVWNGTGWNLVNNSYANASYDILPATPPDGLPWATAGLLPLGGASIADGMDQVNEILLKLAPPKPINLSGMTLAFKGTSVYTAAESGSGTVRSAVVNTTSPIVATPQSPDSINTLFYYNIGDTLTASIDGVSAGSVVLAGSGNVGINGALNVVANNDPWAGTAGKANFWFGLRAEIDPVSALSLGIHTYQISDTSSGSTPVFTFYVDDPAVTMSIIGSSLTTSPPMSKYLSGVPSVQPSSSFVLSAFSAVGVVGQYYNSSEVASISCNVSGVSTVACPAGAIPATPPSGTYGNANVVSHTIAMPSSAYNENITFTLTPYNSKSASGTPAALSSGYRIDTSTETERVYSGDSTNTYPAISTTAGQCGAIFDSTQSLVGLYVGELQKINGTYEWPVNASYASYIGSNGAGPVYTGATGSVISGQSGTWRWVTYHFTGEFSNNSAFTLTFNNPVGFSADTNQITANMLIYVQVAGTSGTGWLNANAAYPGVGTPQNNGDPAMVAGQSDAADKRITFGTVVRTGDLYVRVAINSTSSISFSGVTIGSVA